MRWPLAIVVGQMKSREQEAAHRCRALEESRDRLYLDYWSQLDVIDDLQARLAKNNADLISKLQENFTSLKEAAEEAYWTDWSQRDEIRRLEGIVDSKNISRMEESIDWERSHNFMLHEENCRLSGEVGLDYKLGSTICGPALQWGRQWGWTTTRPTTICHFFLVLTTMGVIGQ